MTRDVPRGEPAVGVVGADLDGDLAADAVRPADPADHETHGPGSAGRAAGARSGCGEPRSLTGSRPPRPGRRAGRGRPGPPSRCAARGAVRPPRPMTLPRSSGCTRTSRTLPRRWSRSRTRTSSGCSTMPLTRCSRASSSMSGLGGISASTASDGVWTGASTFSPESRGLLLGLLLRRGRARLGLVHRPPWRRPRTRPCGRPSGAATCIGAGAASPLNFCQSPETLRIAVTASVGCAPTVSQYCARSEFTSMNEGSSFGWYLPISSIARPSRLVRASATMIRYCAFRILPMRLSLILTATVWCLLRCRLRSAAAPPRGDMASAGRMDSVSAGERAMRDRYKVPFCQNLRACS